MKREKTKMITSIGGQALMEGIMMRGPKKTTVAIRNHNGEIELEEINPLNLEKKYKLFSIPIIRGVVRMIDSLVTGNKALMLSADKAIGDEEVTEDEMSKFDKWLNKHFGDKIVNIIMMVSMVIAVAFCIAVFFFVPTWIFNLLAGWLPFLNDSMVWRSALEGIMRIILFLVYMALCTMNKDVKRVFQYHGAEHKTIFCYEYALDLTVENVRKQRRFHPRCGTSFIVIMLIIGIIIGLFIPFTDVWLRSSVKILLLPITVGVGYELIKICGRHDNLFTRIISAPGMWVQRITTKEPKDDMIEVAIEAMKDVIPENGEDRIG